MKKQTANKQKTEKEQKKQNEIMSNPTCRYTYT